MWPFKKKKKVLEGMDAKIFSLLDEIQHSPSWRTKCLYDKGLYSGYEMKFENGNRWVTITTTYRHPACLVPAFYRVKLVSTNSSVQSANEMVWKKVKELYNSKVVL